MELTQHVASAAKQNGTWVNYPGDEHAKFLIASPTGTAYRVAFRKKVEDLKRACPKPTPEQLDVLTDEMTAECVILNWDGLTNDGKSFVYSPANALLLLKHVPAVREFILASSQDYENFRIESAEEAKKILGE